MLLSISSLIFFDKVADWTTKKFREKKVRGFDNKNKQSVVERDDILGMICCWFIFGLVTLPSVDMYFTLGLNNILKLLKIEERDEVNLPGIFLYNQLAASVQWNDPVPPQERLHKNGQQDFLYLIRPLLELMQKNFPQAWTPSVDLTADESLWSFKGRTFLKRFMKDKPKKYGFLEYALCTLGGYFYLVIVHHVPGKLKRQKRKLDESNLDKDACLQLKLQKRYGEQGALVVRLCSQLKYNGHHIIGDNAFSSVQLASDLKHGNVPGMDVKKCDYTGTQCMLTGKKGTSFHLNFAEYRNLPTEPWGRIKKYTHEWFSDNEKLVSLIKFHDKKHITLISTCHHGSSVGKTERTRNGSRSVVDIPTIVKEYSFKKVGVDVGDQQLRNKVSYADQIRSKGWSRKWGMHAVQQCRHNAFLCWKDIHGFKTGSEEKCKMWSDDGSGSSKILWAFQIGLIKGLLAYIRQFKRAKGNRSKRKYVLEDVNVEEHTIVNRGSQWINMSCAVCLYDKKIAKSTKAKNSRVQLSYKVGRTPMWCPQCRAHACRTHRADVHLLTKQGVELFKYHNEKRVIHTSGKPPKPPKPPKKKRKCTQAKKK